MTVTEATEQCWLEGVMDRGVVEEHHGQVVRLQMYVVETLDPEVYVVDTALQESANIRESPHAPGPRGYAQRLPVIVKRVQSAAAWSSSVPHLQGADGLPGVSLDDLTHACAALRISEASCMAGGPLDYQTDKCMVLLYGDVASSVKVHDMLDIVGVLDPARFVSDDEPLEDVILVNGMLLDANMAREDFEELESGTSNAHCKPDSELPLLRVHAAQVHRLDVCSGTPFQHLLLKKSMQGDFLSAMRAEALRWLSLPLGGDLLAAELVLLQLISKSAGVSQGQVNGRMSLHISGLPAVSQADLVPVQAAGENGCSQVDAADRKQDATPLSPSGAALAHSMAAIYPRLLSMLLNDQTLAEEQWVPEHDPAANRLRTGKLQAAPHTCCVLDATCDVPFASTDPQKGATLARNLTALKTYLSDGVLSAHYAYQQVLLPTSCPIVLLTATTGSPLACACHVKVPLVATAPLASLEQVLDASSAQPLQSIRAYLASLWENRAVLSYDTTLSVGDEPGNSNLASNAPSWMHARLLKEATTIAQLCSPHGPQHTDRGRAFDLSVTLLHSMALSHGHTVVGEGAWTALRKLVGMLARRNAVVGAGKAHEAVATVIEPQSGHKDPNCDRSSLLSGVQEQGVAEGCDSDMKEDDAKVQDAGTTEQAPEPELSRGAAMIQRLRAQGRL